MQLSGAASSLRRCWCCRLCAPLPEGLGAKRVRELLPQLRHPQPLHAVRVVGGGERENTGFLGKDVQIQIRVGKIEANSKSKGVTDGRGVGVTGGAGSTNGESTNGESGESSTAPAPSE